MNKVIMLGAGGSTGVPTAIGYWGQCDPSNPKNLRTRASIYLEVDNVKILIDTSPDLRHQMLRHNIDDFDAVLFTHDHADHSHGIDELKSIFQKHDKQRLPIYGSHATIDSLKARFAYLFSQSDDSPYLSILEPYIIDGNFKVKDIEIISFPQIHGRHMISTGFRFKNFAYSTDFSDLTPEAISQLQGLDTWIVDCLSLYTPPTHQNLAQSLTWIETLKPKHAILTHMGPTLDYQAVSAMIPENVEPGYDGLTIQF